ncbi:MAG: hypothetical protein KBC42_03080 [Candidatus Pacebacteria bacterium]|nr:hypothetical protein [Candidatus Paceibacterota bacterium]MBP9780883.1 hypothetical protein [Candidatus Paceibacterota bacterium]
MVYQQKMWQSYLVFFLFLALTVYAFVYRLSMPVETPIPTGEQVSNFEECASAGNPIMESFPRQCADGGKTFTEGVLYNDSGNEIVPDGAIFGKVEIGPFCPVEREGVPCNPPTEAYTSRIARLYDSTGTHVIEWRNIKDDGTFEFSPPPGEYYVDVYPGGMGPVEKQWVEVVSDEGTGVLIVIDTGIR